MTKPKVVVAVFTQLERTGWINPGLAMRLLELSHSQDYDVVITCVLGRRPVEYARNYCMTRARDKFHADWLLMVDSDQDFSMNPLEVLRAARDKYVVGLPTFVLSSEAEQRAGRLLVANVENCGREDGEFQEVSHVGTGAMFIHRSVWECIPGPWFKTILHNDERSSPEIGEDFFFCDRVREFGFKVWIAARHGLYHFHTTELLHMAVLQNGGPVTPLARDHREEGQ